MNTPAPSPNGSVSAAPNSPPSSPICTVRQSGSRIRFAEARDINNEITKMILDESIKTREELIPKVLEAAKRRDVIEQSAVEASTRADQAMADAKK